MGARNYAHEEREQHDYYATEPKATRLLLERERFSPLVWEPACGEGHMAKVLEEYGYRVYASDLIERGSGDVLDFLACTAPPCQKWQILSQIRRISTRRSLWNTRWGCCRTAASARCS